MLLEKQQKLLYVSFFSIWSVYMRFLIIIIITFKHFKLTWIV